jgi:hypothetical protein
MWHTTFKQVNQGDYRLLVVGSQIVNLTSGVITLALGLQPKQGFARVRAKKEARESHLMLPGMQKNVRE